MTISTLTTAKAALLGALQGATEFLPVSSSGHLVIAQHLLGVRMVGEGLLAFDVCLHFGTLVAVVAVFWRDLLAIAFGIFGRTLAAPAGGGLTAAQARRFFLLLLLGTVPAVVVGLGFEEFFEGLVANPAAAGGMLLVTGTFLFFTRYARERGEGVAGLRAGRTLAIGCAQAAAIVPGISRSGATIATGLFLGLDRTLAARFSFLLAVPVIAGATVLKLGDLAALPKDALVATIVGTVVAAVVGFLCIRWLLAIIRRGRFSWFAYYCWAAGLATILYTFSS